MRYTSVFETEIIVSVEQETDVLYYKYLLHLQDKYLKHKYLSRHCYEPQHRPNIEGVK